MATDFLSLLRSLAPDLTEELGRRALILERISALQPVGRRQLAQRLNLPEREVRNTALLLDHLGYVELTPSGMRLSEKAGEVLDAAREFSKALSGLTEMEKALSRLLPVDRVVIVPGDADADEQVLLDAGRACAARLRGLLQNGSTLAVTGGRSVAAVARSMQRSAAMNVMVVPARGSVGRTVELQANTLAEELAGRLGGHYRLIHLPDHLDPQAMQEMQKLPEVREAMELLQRADVVLHGISRAPETMRERGLSPAVQSRLRAGGARGECFGAYFDLEGRCLLETSSIGVNLGGLRASCRMVAVAVGASKAEAIVSVLRHRPHALLATDEGAARRMIALARGDGAGSSFS